MLRIALLFTLALLALTGCQTMSNSSQTDTRGTYRHVVSFKFKDTATKAQIDEINVAFAALKSKIDTIRHFEWGPNVSPEDHANGMTHVYVVSFDDKAGLDVYLPHPAHKAFVELLKPKLDQVFVVDYVARSDAP